MKKQIEWLLMTSPVSNYQVSQATGISQVALSKYTTGKSEIGNITLDNALKLFEYYKEVVKKMENKYGTVTHEGVTYTMLDQPELTGRQILEWKEEEGYAEFSAPAVDSEGNEFEVRWQLRLVDENGDGIEDLSNLDWDDVCEVVKM